MQLFDEGDRVKDRDDMNRFGTVTLVSSTMTRLKNAFGIGLNGMIAPNA
jgi:hypothetical protein